ncbi:hypothetical protein L1987_22592 [Smallanthus sonchifolius]|uniref:Uncharacterized protein n=1 Tax=Smallanthus sonchifolius TaxID=185202 RepID=A0ACB9IEJ1_9ASTR|nr:hypothetical protein L1987_22592 [Smallanthus sonchifolius]
MATTLQTIDVDIGTTNKPPRLQSAAEYRNWKQRIAFMSLTSTSGNRSLVFLIFQWYVKLVYELRSAEVELDNAEVVRRFMTSLPQKWLVYTIPIRRIENLNTYTLEELYEALKNYEIEDNQLQENIVKSYISALNKDIAELTDQKNILEIQQEDLLVKLTKARSKLVVVKNVPPPFNENYTFTPESNIDTSHVPNFSLSADPDVSSSPEEIKFENEYENGKCISEDVNEYVLRDSDKENVNDFDCVDEDADVGCLDMSNMYPCKFIKNSNKPAHFIYTSEKDEAFEYKLG